jgi:hypothetical protein
VAEEYSFEVAAKLDKAIASIDKFADGAQKTLDKINLNTAVTSIKAGFDLVTEVGHKAFESIKAFAEKAVEASNAADKANIELANSLRVTGDYSAAAVSKFDKLAESIASTTTYSELAVKSSLALAKQYSLTNEEAAKVVKVSADLAAIQGSSLDEATRRVAQTFNGFVDKGLNKVIPSIKKLSQESLLAGGAIALIEARVGGSAKALGENFSGASTRAGHALDKILETFGDFITKNPAIIAGLNTIADSLKDFNAELIKGGGQLREVVTGGFLLLVQTTPLVVKSLGFMDNAFSTTIATLKDLLIIAAQGPTAILQAVTGSTDALDDLNKSLANVDNSINASKRSDTLYAPLAKSAQVLADKVTAAAKSAGDLNKAVDASGKSTSGLGVREAEAFRKSIAEIAKEPITYAFNAVIKSQALSAQEKAAIGAGVLASVVKGADGARKSISSAVGAVADAIVPGIGGAVGEIVDVLSQGPEKTKEMVTEFVDAIPEMIQNLADSLPILIETLAEKLPPALAKAMPIVAIAFSTSLVSHIPDIVAGFVRGLIQGAKDFINELVKQIQGAITGGNGEHKAFSSNGGSAFGRIFGDVLTGGINEITGNAVGNFIDNINPFADGGRIPNDPKYEGDKYPARLNAGEQVLGKDLSTKLEAALSGGGFGGGGTMIVKMMLGEQQLAQAILKLNRGDFRLA